MPHSDLVSVIIPTYNRPGYLPQTIESVLDQSYPSKEIIVVDDGSDDEGAATRRLLEPYMRDLTYVYQNNRGIGAAVNTGLTHANGTFIQRLDDDDLLAKEKLTRSVALFQSDPEIGLVATGYHLIDEAGNRERTRMPQNYPANAQYLFSLMACIAPQACVMVRKSVHETVGLYRSGILGEDYDMWIRIARRYKVATIREPLACYRRHSQNITRPQNAKRLEQDVLTFVTGHLETTPLQALVPGFRSRPHVFALKAAVYLMKGGIHVNAFPQAAQALAQAAEDAPEDPILRLWQQVLSVHRQSPAEGFAASEFPEELRDLADTLQELNGEFKRLADLDLPFDSPEMTTFRSRFGRLKIHLIRATYRKAIGQ